MAKVWHMYVDWNNDGALDATDEAGNIREFTSRRGRQFWLRSDYSGFEPVMVGEMTVILSDENHRYDPYNTGSALYPNVLPGRLIQVSVVDSGTYYVFTGKIADIQPDVGDGVYRTKITAYDGTWLLQYPVNSAMYTNIRVDTAIGNILTAVGWAGGSALDSMSDVMPYWGMTGNYAINEIFELAECSLARFFISANGTAKCYGRQRNPAVSTTLYGTDVQWDIANFQPWEVVRNSIGFGINGLSVPANGVELWKLSDTPGINNGQSLTYWVSYTYLSKAVYGTSIINPVTITDFLGNTSKDGLGSNLTAGFSVTCTAYASTAKLVVTNSSGSNGYITLLRLRGDPISSSTSSILAEDATSITAYGKRSLQFQNKWFQNSNVANDFSIALLSMTKDAAKFPRVRLRSNPANVSSTADQFGLDLFDWVTVNIATAYINATMALGYIEQNWMEPTGQVIETIYQFEPTLFKSGTYWVFTTNIGTSSYFGW